MTARRLVEFCDCGEPLRPDNDTGVCAACRWESRNARLLARQAEHRRNRRAALVAERLKDLGAPSVKEQPEGKP